MESPSMLPKCYGIIQAILRSGFFIHKIMDFHKHGIMTHRRQEHIEKIYQPSFTTKKQGLDFGLGLGLSIVRRLVDSYNGTIGLTSTDELTTFTINLPTTKIHGND
jgi:sensor histidine kinase regulating citrate/malate metabolism